MNVSVVYTATVLYCLSAESGSHINVNFCFSSVAYFIMIRLKDTVKINSETCIIC